MGWFGFGKKENNLAVLPPLQQVNPGAGHLSPGLTPSINNPSEVLQVSRELRGEGMIGRNEPFFVRIDKFNEAKNNLIEIGKKMKEMESVLVKIGEIKRREDEEIDSWREDMKRIRSYLEEINESVFSKL